MHSRRLKFMASSTEHDGLHLQARSQKYGKSCTVTSCSQLFDSSIMVKCLQSHLVLTVPLPPYLVKKQKHFHNLEQYGIGLILGCNGFIWAGEHIEAKDDMVEDDMNPSGLQMLGSELFVLVAGREVERRGSHKK
ncbi:exosome complex component RRP4 [Spatholobus suberectus]|nr:exosome complex component RRP4 [Spatholobus suberectus]